MEISPEKVEAVKAISNNTPDSKFPFPIPLNPSIAIDPFPVIVIDPETPCAHKPISLPVVPDDFPVSETFPFSVEIAVVSSSIPICDVSALLQVLP